MERNIHSPPFCGLHEGGSWFCFEGFFLRLYLAPAWNVGAIVTKST